MKQIDPAPLDSSMHAERDGVVSSFHAVEGATLFVPIEGDLAPRGCPPLGGCDRGSPAIGFAPRRDADRGASGRGPVAGARVHQGRRVARGGQRSRTRVSTCAVPLALAIPAADVTVLDGAVDRGGRDSTFAGEWSLGPLDDQ